MSCTEFCHNDPSLFIKHFNGIMGPVCENCGILITWQPTVVDGQRYCCLGCATGGPCTCDYSNLPRQGEFRAMVQATSVIVLGPAEHDGRLSFLKQDGRS